MTQTFIKYYWYFIIIADLDLHCFLIYRTRYLEFCSISFAVWNVLIQDKIYCTVKILKFGTPQTIAIIVLKIEKFDVSLH